MWSNTSFDYLRRLPSNIKLRRRRSRSFLYGPGEFNAKVGPRRTPEELHIWTHGLQWNDQVERLSKFIMTTKTIHGNLQFEKPSSLRWTWESPGGGYRNKIDHIIVNKRFCLTDVAAVPKFYAGSDHRLLRERFSFTRRAEKAAKFRERNPRTIINWDLFATLASFCTPSISQAERMLTEFDETCGCIGLQLNLQKTMFMRNGWISDAPFTLNGTKISECTSYVYLDRELNMMP
ncbi:hypothetical protein RB195_011017 [Necator americanus]|uniref:Endonuclease/exonuclease/phosphatase domain-containing protein n=1 Tax=Necator americanus TaxID=51031 RepID=A0ABR1D0I4_NECAM